MRVGLGLLRQVAPISQPWVAIIDHSIDVGTKKALVVLRVPLAALSQRGAAIQLGDCECVGLTIAETVNGETVALQLEAIFQRSGTPAAITKDCDATLQKGVRLWMENARVSVPVIEDIGHVLAAALKAQFEQTSEYQRFTSLAAKAAKALRQTELAFLIPPKLRSKGRFLNIGKLARWGEKMLGVLAVKGRARKEAPRTAPRHLRAVLPTRRTIACQLNRQTPFVRMAKPSHRHPAPTDLPATRGQQRHRRIAVRQLQAYPRAQPAGRHESHCVVDPRALRSSGRSNPFKRPRARPSRRSGDLGTGAHSLYHAQEAPSLFC
ncbi:MAG: hypothetical protein P8Z33_15185 [Gammaproteobacteria bacterium]